ncbi:alpha/beta hydrolase fold domain-containing protein [Pirellulaceae bacterium SH449]
MWRWIKIVAWTTLALGTVVVSVAGFLWWYYHPAFDRQDGVQYGERNGKALTMDIIRPKNPNGLAVAFMVSGGWKSKAAGEAEAWLMAPLLRRGYTIFAICHISQPDSTVPEIIEDVTRGIRTIRHRAKEYGIDPERIGVTGGSAGGHLSLMLATRGKEPHPDPRDDIDRESASVQAVAIFYPVTDLLNLDGSTEDLGDGGPPKSFVNAFGPDAQDKERWQQIGREASPVYFVDNDLPPTLIYHGDSDTLVPLKQSERFRDSAQVFDREVRVVVHKGGNHGWATMVWDIRTFGDWFDRHLQNR